MTPGIIACLCIACFLLGSLISFVLTVILAAAGRQNMCEDCKYKEFYHANRKKTMPVQEAN